MRTWIGALTVLAVPLPPASVAGQDAGFACGTTDSAVVAAIESPQAIRPGVYVYPIDAGEFHARRKRSVLP